MKPKGYRHAVTVNGETPYRVAAGVPQGVQAAQGVLQAGQVIYLKEKIDKGAAKTIAPAYAEDIGLISVDSEMLHLP